MLILLSYGTHHAVVVVFVYVFAGIQKMLGPKQTFIGSYLIVKSFYLILFVCILFIVNPKYQVEGVLQTGKAFLHPARDA